MIRPTIGQQVHYVSLGSVGGRYPSVCRAAVVTEVDPADPATVGLYVINPTGSFFRSLGDGGETHDGGSETSPEIYGAHCNGDTGRVYPGGTWHHPVEME